MEEVRGRVARMQRGERDARALTLDVAADTGDPILTRSRLFLWTLLLAAVSFFGLLLGTFGPVLPWRPLAVVLLGLGFLGLIPVSIPPFLVLAALVVLVFRREAGRALRLFGLAALWFAITLCASFGGYAIGQNLRMKAFQRLAERSRPLVAAIHEFERSVGRPPRDLHELTPALLSKVPSTGMGAYPSYKYVAGQAARFDGNPCVLLIECGGPGPSFDMFLYFPLQNYPRMGYGGSLERLGQWAYVP